MNQDETIAAQRWQQLLLMLKERFGKEPNMEAILFLIGINEYRGRMPMHKFSKEQKQDLMHVAVCTLLSNEGFFELEKYDEEGWPHFTQLKANTPADLVGQEDLLREKIMAYFGY
ncbi:MAG TPA: hypothetical protein VFL76_07285 [Edaphocola sp.]|nr:hypothetical protein [Edaphocola sp.]